MEAFLLNHAKGKTISFHMPGHKGSDFYSKFGHNDFLENMFDFDITEIEGADNLFQREGIIKKLSEKYATLYGVKESFLLVNGSSCGLISAVLATVKKGNKIIMARNCHKSVFNAIMIGEIEPIYVYPEIINDWGISGQICPKDIETLLSENPETEAVILPSPNYYGICSDVEEIGKIVHKHGKILIIDQAHGAHLKFFNEQRLEGFPLAAEIAGADIVVNSTHKTLASLTQSAILNVCSENVNIETLEDKLQIMESTSPSYILMCSLDVNNSIISKNCKAIFKEWAGNLEYFYSGAKKIKGLKLMEVENGLDKTKLNIDLSKAGYNGKILEKTLIEKYGIYAELNSGNIVMCMTGIGNTKEDYKALLEALEEMSNNPIELSKRKKNNNFSKEKIKDLIGKTCDKAVIPYPPGIPLICAGEKISAEHIEILIELIENEEKVLGLTDKKLIKVR